MTRSTVRVALSLCSACFALSGVLPIGGRDGAPMGASIAEAQARGRVQCRITENGAPASGTIVVRNGATEVATAACGAEPVAVPAGAYSVVLRLDGAIDRPEQTRSITVAAGETAQATADFTTAILQVDIQADGRRAAGMVRIFRNGQQIGTLGSGVAGRLSAGTYDVVARYRTREQRFDGVSLAAGQRRALSATF